MGMFRSFSIVWMSRSGPVLKAALIRFVPAEFPVPGMSTHRSRGIDIIHTSLVAGTNRATMMTSLR